MKDVAYALYSILTSYPPPTTRPRKSTGTYPHSCFLLDLGPYLECWSGPRCFKESISTTKTYKSCRSDKLVHLFSSNENDTGNHYRLRLAATATLNNVHLCIFSADPHLLLFGSRSRIPKMSIRIRIRMQIWIQRGKHWKKSFQLNISKI